jgi:hypothetical protein
MMKAYSSNRAMCLNFKPYTTSSPKPLHLRQKYFPNQAMQCVSAMHYEFSLIPLPSNPHAPDCQRYSLAASPPLSVQCVHFPSATNTLGRGDRRSAAATDAGDAAGDFIKNLLHADPEEFPAGR